MTPAEERFMLAYKLAGGPEVRKLADDTYAPCRWEGEAVILYTPRGYISRSANRPAGDLGNGGFATEAAAMVYAVSRIPELRALIDPALDELLAEQPELKTLGWRAP